MAPFSVSQEKTSHQLLKVALPAHSSLLLQSCALSLTLRQIAPHSTSTGFSLTCNSDHFKPLSYSRTFYVPSELIEADMLRYAKEQYPYCHCGAKMDAKSPFEEIKQGLEEAIEYERGNK